jgi:hypothetical protein
MAKSKEIIEDLVAKELQTDNQYDIGQHEEYLKELGIKDIKHSMEKAESLVQDILTKEKTKLPEPRLAAFKSIVDTISTLDVRDSDIMEQFKSWEDKDYFAVYYADEVVSSIEKLGLFQVLKEKSMQDVLSTSEKDFVFNNAYIIIANSKMIDEIAEIHLKHKKQDIKQFVSELLMNGITEELASLANIKAREGIIPRLTASIKAGTMKYTEITSNLQKLKDIPKQIKDAETAIKDSGTLGLNEDALAHYVASMGEYITKLKKSKEEAENLFATKDYINRAKQVDPRKIIEEIKKEAGSENIKILKLSDDAKVHYYNLLTQCCHALEDLIGIVHTNFANLVSKLSGIKNPLERMNVMLKAQSKPMLTQYKGTTLTSSSLLTTTTMTGTPPLMTLPDAANSSQPEAKQQQRPT